MGLISALFGPTDLRFRFLICFVLPYSLSDGTWTSKEMTSSSLIPFVLFCGCNTRYTQCISGCTSMILTAGTQVRRRVPICLYLPHVPHSVVGQCNFCMPWLVTHKLNK